MSVARQVRRAIQRACTWPPHLCSPAPEWKPSSPPVLWMKGQGGRASKSSSLANPHSVPTNLYSPFALIYLDDGPFLPPSLPGCSFLVTCVPVPLSSLLLYIRSIHFSSVFQYFLTFFSSLPGSLRLSLPVCLLILIHISYPVNTFFNNSVLSVFFFFSTSFSYLAVLLCLLVYLLIFIPNRYPSFKTFSLFLYFLFNVFFFFPSQPSVPYLLPYLAVPLSLPVYLFLYLYPFPYLFTFF